MNFIFISAVSYVTKGRLPLTLKHGKPDHEATDVRTNFLEVIDAVYIF